MNNIKLIRGKIEYKNNSLYCNSYVNSSIQILIPFEYRSNSIPNDIVLINIFPIQKWLTKHEEEITKENIKKYINEIHHKYINNNFEEIRKTEELLKIIEELQNNKINEEENEINPIGEVILIEKYEKLENIKGIIHSGYFWPNDNSLFPIPIKNEIQYAESIGNINRKDSLIFIPQKIREIKELSNERKNELQKITQQKIELYFNPIFKNENILYFSIDDEQTKMFDDCFSFCFLENNQYSIGIHCSNYVIELLPNSSLLQKLFFSMKNGTFKKEKEMKRKFKEWSLHLGKTSKAFSVYFIFDSFSNEIISIRCGTSEITIKAQFSFDSFHKSLLLKEIQEERIIEDKNKILKNILDFKVCLEKLNIIEKYERNFGSIIVESLGMYFSKQLAIHLKQKYSHLTILSKDRKNNDLCSFRSPLRKVDNVFSIRQIYSFICNFNTEEMIYFVCRNDEILFKYYFNLFLK